MELWRDIPGHEGRYAVSNLGRVYAHPKKVKKPSGKKMVEQSYAGKMLATYPRGRDGYLAVRVGYGGEKFSWAVHRLVLLAFVGPCPDGMEACHNDGDETNNHLSNLRWDTHLSNNRDRKRHGRYATGEKHHAAKLTPKQVAAIRAGTLTAKEAGIGRSQHHRIRTGVSWK